MSFPPHIDAVLTHYRIRADTKAALYELYLTLGDEVLEVFADLSEGVAAATMLDPDDTLLIRERVVERYLTRNHPRWLAGSPTASLWHPRAAQGRASGLAMPLGELTGRVRTVVGPDQPLPDGILILGRNAHSGGRPETISFDVVARELADAVAIAKAEGQQHTIPGSVGATSGTFDGRHHVALLWEIQPNVYKPAGGRNRALAKIWRRHRNWHLVTLAAAVEWLSAQRTATFILRGSALAATHEMNPAAPISDTIASHHDRTAAGVARALGLTLAEPAGEDEMLLLDSDVMNTALRKHVLRTGAAGAMWRVDANPR